MDWLELLVARGHIPAERAEQVRQSLLERRQGPWEIAAEFGLPASELAAALADESGLPFWATIEDAWLDPELVRDLPVEWVRTHRVLPIRRGNATVAVIDRPEALLATHDVSVMLGCDLPAVFTTPDELERAVERCYARRAAPTIAPTEPTEREAAQGPTAEDLLRAADGAPVTQFVNYLLLDALRSGASDIHLEPREDSLRVRFRIDGLLYDQPSPPRGIETAVISRLKVMARMDIAERRLPQDGMTRVRIGAREVDIRVSSVPIADGERLVLRLLNRDSTILPLTKLGMDEHELRAFRELLHEPQGIILVTGPTGSGKTTTLYAALQELDTLHRNVITIEDPIEYRLEAISQIQVNPRIELTFARLLRHVLRQDPDVILVGETRDLETAEIAVRASLTGHLVFTTLHTNDAVSAALRLADMGVEPYLLAASLRGILAQRLIRRLCPHCREARPLTDAELEEWGSETRRWFASSVHWVGRGCEHCRDGYRGRVGLFELLLVTPPLAEALRRNAPLAELRSLAVASGMRPLWQAGLARAAVGDTSLAELRRVLGHRRDA